MVGFEANYVLSQQLTFNTGAKDIPENLGLEMEFRENDMLENKENARPNPSGKILKVSLFAWER